MRRVSLAKGMIALGVSQAGPRLILQSIEWRRQHVISIIFGFHVVMYQGGKSKGTSGTIMIRFALPAILALLAFPASAQHAHPGSAGPTETGQSAFAAISEIVQILSDDPHTDWAKVNIQALRDHLVDMDLVTTQAKVATRTEDRVVEFVVMGQGDVVNAVRRMTLAHSPMLEMAAGWSVAAEPSDGGATMRVEAGTDQELARVLGLGFFGVMTIGAHHQAHHMQMALGEAPHH
ncbi:hypothetical protein [Phaeobacter sp. 11ANDIMAR09]|uniref:hypothetical protein n=1 Tax=Phaeobacter sp. 11ANDIMAR09 TaxID=1225647 RepID=UPI000A98758F|nr:hypothetical protein [Phaeobacter sp. 11ANDIMAR09]